MGSYTLLLLLLFICYTHSVVVKENSTRDAIAVPDVGRIEYRILEMTEMGSRRKLNPFQVCLACRCCVVATDPTTCSNMPCCFGIDCQLPNKPFGVCAFVPKTCNCTSCAST
ncbi:hypothetical protein CTI12_AA387750 [Artemisia annua]|uniref:DUF7866 domain-containing protein n=1 Tax=Artemisia annua TaxID=35608 RepID=A0A2U1MEG9_ARTAN|nr:hypothetical protein CTI12_AA387750 [Artemisia annua]